MRKFALSMLLAWCACGSSDRAPDAPGDASLDASDGVHGDAGLARDAGTERDAAVERDAGPPPTEFGGDRPVSLHVPAGYDGATALPLVVALHGYSPFNGYATLLFHLDALAESEGFFLAAPFGTLDQDGSYFWNGTDACCDLYGAGIDDLTYLTGLVEDIARAYAVDAKRVYVLGHSNGGFMAYRLACERADLFAAIVSYAGASYDRADDCAPSQPVSVLQLHGTADPTIPYAGGANTVGSAQVPFPSAQGTVQRWASYDGCSGNGSAGEPLDLTGDATAEAEVLAYEGCPAGGAVELWTIPEGGHVTPFNDVGAANIWRWLSSHARP